MREKFFLLIFYLFFYAFTVNGQVKDTCKVFLVETLDGNEYIGSVVKDTLNILVLKTEKIGTITVHRSDIVKIRLLKKEHIIGGTAWYENIQATRYFWAPNGYGLKKGEAYYQNMWILYNQAGYGFSNYFSVGVGLVPMFLFSSDVTPVWVTPKFSIPLKENKINLGVGVLAASLLGESNSSFGIVYGVTTFGSRDKNLTIGMGYGYASGNWVNNPIVMVSTMIRTGKRSYFMSENYYYKGGNGSLVIITLGGRSLIKKVAVDYGLVVPFHPSIEEFIAIPWLGITIPLVAK